MNKKFTYNELELINAVKTSITYAEILRKLNLQPFGGNYKTLKIKIKEYKIDINHLKGKSHGKSIPKEKI